jgi:CRP-like cAMP-binding protein
MFCFGRRIHATGCTLWKVAAPRFTGSPQGRQYIFRILQEGDTFAEVPAFDGGMNPVNVEALEACRVWVIEGETLRAGGSPSALRAKGIEELRRDAAHHGALGQ